MFEAFIVHALKSFTKRIFSSTVSETLSNVFQLDKARMYIQGNFRKAEKLNEATLPESLRN